MSELTREPPGVAMTDQSKAALCVNCGQTRNEHLYVVPVGCSGYVAPQVCEPANTGNTNDVTIGPAGAAPAALPEEPHTVKKLRQWRDEGMNVANDPSIINYIDTLLERLNMVESYGADLLLAELNKRGINTENWDGDEGLWPTLAKCIASKIREAEQERELAQSERQLALALAAVRDAERYRWLRVQRDADIAACWILPNKDYREVNSAEELDAAIDSAMLAAGGSHD